MLGHYSVSCSLAVNEQWCIFKQVAIVVGVLSPCGPGGCGKYRWKRSLTMWMAPVTSQVRRASSEFPCSNPALQWKSVWRRCL